MAQNYHSRIFALFLSLSLAWSVPALAQSPAALEITGQTAPSVPVTLELHALDEMPQVEFTTSTIWTDGPVTFSGVPLKTVLGELAEGGSTLEMVALNDYKVTMPLDQLEDGVPIVATRMNGETMAVRDKGPYWVVFPYDSDSKYQSETVYAWSIWQLNRLNIVD